MVKELSLRLQETWQSGKVKYPKTVDLKTVLQATEANPMISTQRVAD